MARTHKHAREIAKAVKAVKGASAKELREVLAVIRDLRESGISEPGYNILGPFTRQPLHLPTSDEEDSRAIHLSRLR